MHTPMAGRRGHLWNSGALAACVVAAACAISFAEDGRQRGAPRGPVAPIDPQKVQDQDAMTWDDYKPIPGTNWSDPGRKPTTRGLRIAIIAIDFDDQPFVITQPKHSDPFGNPQVNPVKRGEVPQFLADFWHKPSALNHGQTIHGYWMEQSGGRYGIDRIDAYGPYRMPRPLWFYGLNEHRQNDSTPDGTTATGRMESDCDKLWREEPGATNPGERALVRDGGRYDAILRIYAGYDETGVWQEFGEMRFETRDDITLDWGNPNKDLPRWVPTRYVPWTSWRAGAQPWGLSSIRQGENSGTIMHELGHSFFATGDNNNNPYEQPYRRAGSGPWDMMDRGSFNGPGGPHTRWVVPVQLGGAMPAGLMLRQKIHFGFLSPGGAPIVRRNPAGGNARSASGAPDYPMPEKVLFLSREGLAKSGLVAATLTARAVDPIPGAFAGVMVRLDGDPVQVTLPPGALTRGRGGDGAGNAAPAADRGNARGQPAILSTQDRTPWEDPETHPLSQGIPNFDNYSIEVVQRIGYDSFCPDSGVLLAKNKDVESFNGGPNGFNCFNWVIDAHPEDVHMIDYKKPRSGTRVYRTIADFRQLNDALFHAGTDSGSQYEWEDPHNRLHFYIIDLHKNPQGILSYTVAVRSLEGPGPHTRGVALDAGPAPRQPDDGYTFTLKNTGRTAAYDAKVHPRDIGAAANIDVYRLSAKVEGQGWTAHLPNALAAVKMGETQAIRAFALPGDGATHAARLIVTATSESDPGKAITATVQVTR
jgi:M6 family metalloprotease-like protein